MENISGHWICIFTWTKMVIHQLKTDGKKWKLLSMTWMVCDFIVDDLRQCEASSLILSLFLSADVPEPWIFSFPFHFPEIKCCWVGWESLWECSKQRNWEGLSVQGGDDTNAKSHRAWDGHSNWWIYSHISPTAFDCHISLSAEVTHQPLFPLSSKYL